MTNPTILVTGASGKLGRETLDFLLVAGKDPARIIATTRDVTKLAGYAEKGVVVRQAVLHDRCRPYGDQPREWQPPLRPLE